ncbi:MAG: Lrp/AsnC family transcriptional regulator [Bacillota bacterium]
MREILEVLSENCRVTPAEIAVRLGKTEEEVRAKIADMEKNGVIVKYQALINWEKTGEESVCAMIEVKVSPQREVGFDEVAERIYRYPEVRSVYLMSGDYDLAVLVEGASMKEVAFFVAEKLSTLEHVLSTASHFILKRYKHEGQVFEGKSTPERLVISP